MRINLFSRVVATALFFALGTVAASAQVNIGAVAEDSSGYPDCRPEFYAAFQRAIDVGTRPETRVEIRTPVIELSKPEIIRRGLELNAPLALTWSCYQAKEQACGRCDSCAAPAARVRAGGNRRPYCLRLTQTDTCAHDSRCIGSNNRRCRNCILDSGLSEFESAR